MENYAEIEFPDIANYLLFTKSRFTKEQLKAYKSLEAYHYFVAGWVQSIHVGNVTEKTVVRIGKVSLSILNFVYFIKYNIQQFHSKIF